MSTLKVNTIEPEGATTDLAVGIAGQDTVVGADSIKVNTLKDLGGGYKIDALLTPGAATWTCPAGVTSVELLIVGAGGAGGQGYYGGGGGAGGIVHDTAYTVVPAVVYDATIGTHNGYSNTENLASGDNTTWNDNTEGSGATLTAIGGGAGGVGQGEGTYQQHGRDGGCGGAAAGYGNGNKGSSTQSSAGTSSSGTITVYGEDGGTSTGNPSGGGGGAGYHGFNASDAANGGNIHGGPGGIGKYFANFADYGVDGWFAGGGGGGAYPGADDNFGGAGGKGGGGKGQKSYPTGDGYGPGKGYDGTGAGGGGGGTGGGNYGGNGAVLIRYATGAPTNIFTSDGSASLSGITSGFARTSDVVLIASSTVSAQTSISFISGLDSTYDEYVFEFFNINPSVNAASLTFQCSIDGGSNYNVNQTTTLFRSNQNEDGGNAVFGYLTGRDLASSAGTGFQYLGFEIGNAADTTMVGEMHLFNPSSTMYNKNWYATIQLSTDAPASQQTFPAGVFNITTSAINAIQFKTDSGNFDGTIKMYGIK